MNEEVKQQPYMNIAYNVKPWLQLRTIWFCEFQCKSNQIYCVIFPFHALSPIVNTIRRFQYSIIYQQSQEAGCRIIIFSSFHFGVMQYIFFMMYNFYTRKQNEKIEKKLYKIERKNWIGVCHAMSWLYAWIWFLCCNTFYRQFI